MECLNCGVAVTGRYCFNCGQRVSFHLGFHDFFHEALHELAHFDDKILHTLRLLLFKPGELTREFIEGKRARSISPLRLYLIASALFFWIVFTFGSSIGTLKIGSQAAPIGGAHDSAAPPASKEDTHIREVAESVGHALPKAMFLLMPIFALVLWALYHRQQSYYIPHLYFSIHLHAFAFIVLSVLDLMKATGIRLLMQASVLGLLWIVYYLIAGQRRFYGTTRRAAILRGFASAFIYLALYAATMAGLAMMVLART